MVSGVEWPGGDPFLQRQNEPSIAVSSRNPFHLLAGANDYRSVDLAEFTNGETGDAWLGLFKSLDGGNTWRSILLPGCPYNTPICSGAPLVRNANEGLGFQAAADPTVRAGTNGMFYYAGLVFNRGNNPASAIIVSRLIDLNNKENADPNDILNGDSIQYVSTAIAATGTPSQFLDKPSMAVDIPRSNPGTCNLTINQPANGEVKQSFRAGNVYVAYTAFTIPVNPPTDPTALTNPASKIYFVRSTDCGATWSHPLVISGSGMINQGAALAIDPSNGKIYVAWRQFKSSFDNTLQPDAIFETFSRDGGETFTTPVRVSTFMPFDQGTTGTSFRTNAYPTIAVDASDRIYIAYSARNTVPSGDARIVLTTSPNGSNWTTPVPIDNPPIDPLSNPAGRGHQIMPTLSFAAGSLSVLYYDLRLDHYFGLFTPLPAGLYSEIPTPAGELLNPFLTAAVFNPVIDDFGDSVANPPVRLTMRRHTFDLRMARALPGVAPVFAPSVLVSQYAFGCCATTQTDIEQLQFNAPNLPMFKAGSAPFMGDYVDLAAGPSFLPPGTNQQSTEQEDEDQANGWQYNLSPSTPTTFHAAWTDNRDVQPPPNGDWTQYTPPASAAVGSTSVFDPTKTPPACNAEFTGTRNQNIYTAPISNGLIFGAPTNTKQLGTTVFNGNAVLFQRAFAVVAQNTSSVVKSFRLTIANQPTGGSASFLQFSQLTTLDLSIPALSSATRPVFVSSTNPTASVTVNIAEITAPQGTLVTNGLASSTTLNPDPTNPAITNPAITNPAITNPAITNFEVYNPAITNPAITNPAITNPAITNPAITNPAITNSTLTNVTVVNPAITNLGPVNPAITNASIANPAITNPAITNVNPANTSVSDTQWAVTNTGNTEGAFTINLASTSPVPLGNVLQMIITKLYQTPAAQDCNLALETHDVVVTNIVNPVLLSPTSPAITNPAITNPAITNATVALSPGETSNIIIRVINTNTNLFPTFNASASVVPVAVSQSVNTQTALASNGGTPPPPPITVPPLQITTTILPDAVTGSVYTASVQTVGGNPTAHTFSIASGALPGGLTLDPVAGTITGVVTATGPATFSFQVQVQDVGSTSFPQHTAKQNLSIRVGAPLMFAPQTLAAAILATPYSQTVTVTGGIGTIVQAVTLGALPPGLTLNSFSGLISGTPTAAGAFSFTIQATDSATPPQVVLQGYTINVLNATPASVVFVTQPANSIGGQILAGSPLVVQVNNSSGAPIPGVSVNMAFSGTPPCGAAVLSGTLTQITNASGQASFPDLSIDRGQLGYTLSAAAGNVSIGSNPFTVNGFCATGSMTTARALLNSVTLLNGKVLIAGGKPDFSNQFPAFSSAELYDPVAHSFTTVGSMHSPRAGINMALLQNGLVLVAGGSDGSVNLSSAELFDPATNTFTLIPGSMTIPRAGGTATLLANGKVLITGGNNNGTLVASAEIFDPATNTFTPTSHPMSTPREVHEAILLPNGQVLITGGFPAFGPSGPINPLASAELYDPNTDTFNPTGSMSAPRYQHATALLSTGKVLVYGGYTANNFSGPLATAEIYDPSTGIFSPTATAPQPGAGYDAPVPVLADGTVFLYNAGSADVYDPAVGGYRSAGNTTVIQAAPVTSLLGDGTVLVAGGVGSPAFNTGLATAQIYYSTAPLAPIAITTPSLANASTGQPYTQVLLEQGGVGNLTWTESGALPAGLTFTNQGILIGTPTIAGTFPLTVTVTDSSTPPKTTSANFTLTVANTPLVFTSPTLPTAVAGKPYAQTLPVIGGTQPYNASLTPTSGPLPTGLNLAGNLLIGTPSGTGNFTFTVIVTDSSTPAQTATQTLTIAVNTLAITTTTLPNGIVRVPYNAAISTNGGILPLSFSGATPAFPPGLAINPPSPGSASGALAGTPTQAGTFFFSETVADSSNPAQTATQNYVVTIAPAGSPVPANVTFVSQPQNSVGGQTLSGGPIVVRVTDASNNPVPQTAVVMTLNGFFNPTLPCSVATLGGTLTAVTDSTGQAAFSNLSVDRGGYNYALLASTGSAVQNSGPFSVQGFCASGSLSTQREGHTQDLLGTAQSTFKFPVDPKGAYVFTNTNPAPPGTPDIPDAPLIIPLASIGIKPGDVISGLPVGDMAVCAVGSFCFGEEYTPPVCAVFSSSNTLLPPGTTPSRIPVQNVITPDFTTAFPCQTIPTLFGNLPTDIPQDFFLVGEPVIVPPGAAFLFVAILDSFYTDNSDPNGDLGVQITVNSTTSGVNGDILIAGGFDNAGHSLNTAELYHPLLGFSSSTGNLTDPNGRGNHVSVTLADGRVLLIGGANDTVGTLASAEIYDPSTGAFSVTGSMSAPRFYAAAVRLPDGRVLVSGGFNTDVGQNTAEIYDPATGLWTPTGNMNQGRGRHTMTLLPNGKVLVTGGRDGQVNFVALSSAEIFDPFANQGVGAFTAMGNMNSPRHVHTATLLSNGKVLIAGGFNGNNTSSSVASAEIFDPQTNTFTLTGNLNTARARQTSTLLPDGTVLEAGGINSFNGVVAAAPAEIYSPATGTFAQTGGMITGRELPTASLVLPDGNVLVAGGDDGVNELATTELYFNTIAQAPAVITTASVPNGVISQPYVQLLQQQNRSGPVTWSVASGTLPPGITLAANGFLTGVPTATGSFTFAVQVTDGISTATASFTINVSLSALAFTSNTMPSAGSGRAYSQPLPVTGGTLPYTATLTGGTLPPGLALSSNGLITGTPSSAGSFTFTVNVTDSSTPAQSASQTLTIAVNTLSIVTTALPGGMVGTPYNAVISTAGGTLPLSFSSANAAFPPGLTITQPAANSQSGALAGTPTLAGHYTFSETVTDSSNPAQTATQTYVIDVFPAGSSAVPATLTFLSQPQNSIGGQILTGSPVRVRAFDATNTPIIGASVALSFNGAPPCSTAVLSGTLTAITNGNGVAVFPDLSIDRGQLGYTLLASAGTASAVSQPFTVNGFCSTGSMATGRALLNSVVLLNGKVLVAGGSPSFSNLAAAFSSAELYDPAAHSFTRVGGMQMPRTGHIMVLLQNGLVLVAGGFGGSAVLSSAELFDPATNTFTLLSTFMITGRQGASATLLANGKVLITGGNAGTGTVLASAEIFDPATNTFIAASHPMISPRFLHKPILLPNGKVLITGGFSAFDPNGLPINPLASAELYDPNTDTFNPTGSMSSARYAHASALLSTGKVLVYGGDTANNFTVPLATAEIYDPSTGTFSPTATAPQPGDGYLAPVPVLADGTVFLYNAGSGDVYDPTVGGYRPAGNTIVIQAQPATSLLDDGTVLVTGGVGSPTFDTGLATAQIYYSAAPQAPLQITTAGGSGSATTVFNSPASFAAAAGNTTKVGFNGILPAGTSFQDFNPLTVSPVSFTNPITGEFVDLTTSSFYTPHNYPADFIVDSSSANANNQVVVSFPPTLAIGLDYGGLGFKAGGSGGSTITLSNGFAFPSALTTVGQTQFAGFVSAAPITSLTLSTTNDDWVILDVLVGASVPALPVGNVGKPYTAILLEQGGVGTLTWTQTSGALPQGVTLSANGILSGTPTVAGVSTFTVQLTDSSTPQKIASATLSLTVN